jgi:hypothetical protein
VTTSSGLFDARGCLTAAGVAALSSAPPGQGPPELAAHVVGCARCQQRLLAPALSPAGRKEPARAPALGRTLAIGAALLALIGLLFLTLVRLAGS